MAALDRCGEDERLEGRARLPACLREEVELVVRAARDDRRHRPDRTARRVDGDDRGGRVGGARQRLPDRLLRELLPARLDRRVDLEPTRADGLRTVRLDQLVADVPEEVRLANLLVEPPGAQPDRLPARPPVLRRGDHALLEHRVEHLVSALHRPRRVDERVVRRGRLCEAGEKRRLGQRQRARGAGEVRARGGLRPVRQIAVEDRVEVGREDLLLRPGVVELHRETRLGHLALDRSLVGDVEVADELLGDGRPALDDAACPDVTPQRARDALGVEPAVVVETAVLDRDGRPAEPRRHLAQRHHLAVPLRGDHAEERAIGRVDEGVLADARGMQGVEVAARAERDHGPAGRDSRPDQHDREDDESQREPPSAPGTGAAAARTDRRSGRAEGRGRLERLMGRW